LRSFLPSAALLGGAGEVARVAPSLTHPPVSAALLDNNPH
jgi:hypothetical protein